VGDLPTGTVTFLFNSGHLVGPIDLPAEPEEVPLRDVSRAPRSVDGHLGKATRQSRDLRISAEAACVLHFA
jgi:hypothetical protein